jgi:LPS export ABC transporter permease LptF
MKIIHRYVIREFLESFFFGLLVFSSILLLDQVFQLIDLVLSKGISLLIVIRLFLLILPNIFSLTVPMSALFGIILAYGRLSEDNEITAMRSNGLDYWNFTAPVLVVVLLMSVFLVYFNQYLSPTTHKHFRQIYQEVLTQRPLVKFEEKEITTLGDYRLYVQKVDRASNTLHGVNIYRFSKDEVGVPWRISASSATVAVTPQGVVFYLYNGYWQKSNPSRPDSLVHLTFSNYQFTISLEGNIMPTSQSLREMDINELRREIATYRSKKLPVNFLENELWLRFVLAVAPLAFALTAVPLGIITQRGGRSIGFGVSLLILFGYYTLLVTALNIGEKGFVSPRYILWLPDAATGITGFFLWRRMLKK